MDTKSNFFVNISVLYRNTQKYFDRVLAKYDIGSGQLLYLLLIHENEGITMQDTTRFTELDKGTTTKSIQRLIDQGYVQSVTDENDHRVKRLYTTSKTADIMHSIYEMRSDLRAQLAQDVDFLSFESLLNDVCENSRSVNVEETQEEVKTYTQIKIGGLQKTTLIDYPGKVAATIFTSGCNFKCPYCHNRDLVFVPEDYSFLDVNEIMQFLEKRKGVLDGVCISGGEPLMQEHLIDFLKEIKKFGYPIKLDTNGNMPDKLKEVCETGLVDYVAMDIKNSPDKYILTVGLNQEVFQLDNIKRSIAYLLTTDIDYEFRTTVVKELHEVEDILDIARWIRGAKRYYLQSYEESENVIQQGFSSYSYLEMQELIAQVKEIIPIAELRGVKEG